MKLFTLIFGVKKSGNINNILIITMIGVTLFELLFEVSSRHLNCNVPIIIIMAMGGLNVIHSNIKKIGEKKW